MTTTFTQHFKFGLPDFLTSPWHDDWYALVRKIDSVLFSIAVAELATVWTNSTAYSPGDIVISPEDGLLYICAVAHTSAASPTTFSTDRSNNPTFWTDFGVGEDLSAIEALTGAGIPVRRSDGLWAIRVLVPPAAGLAITNPAGTLGDFTFVLADDLAAVEALASNGIATRTNTNTWAIRAMVAPPAGFTITNPAGTAGDFTFVLANDLSALEALSTSGFPARIGSDTWAIRSLAQPAEGITITNPAGTAGNPTFALANDLAALEGLGSTGIAVRTASDTWAQRQVTQPAAGITVTNPAGVAGNITLALANDLSALEALSTNGYAKRTGSDTWAIVATITVPDGGTGAATLTDRGVLVGRGTGAIEASAAGTTGQVLKATTGANPAFADDVISITFIIDGGGATITTGVKGDLTIPFAATIVEWTLLADQTGSIVVDIWKDTEANHPPTVADTITASAKPTLSSVSHNRSSTLTGWTTAITAGDVLRFNVDSITTCTRVTLSLKCRRL
jgi:hypothetical protein